jgi:hypothetical protein
MTSAGLRSAPLPSGLLSDETPVLNINQQADGQQVRVDYGATPYRLTEADLCRIASMVCFWALLNNTEDIIRFGLDTMSKAGYPPQVLDDIWNRLTQKRGR